MPHVEAQPTAPSPALPAQTAETSIAQHAAWLSRSRFPSLDGLRCLSILPVLWHHATPRPLEGLLGRGPLGVDLFFAISGFLITTLLLRERQHTGTISLRNFYIRRGLRIFPLYYAVLALYALRTAFLMPPSPARSHFLDSIIYYATYTSNWLVDFNVAHPVIFAFSWSLATEEQFYATWPAVVRRFQTWYGPVGFMAILLALDQLADYGVLGQIVPSSSLPFRMLASIAAPICLGALAAYGVHLPRSFGLLNSILGLWWSAPLALAALLVLVAQPVVDLLAVHAAMTALVVAVCIRPDHGLRWLTDIAPLRYIGTISYGMYLFHVSAITATKSLLPAGWASSLVVFVLATALSVAIASLSFHTFEKMFLRLRDRFRQVSNV